MKRLSIPTLFGCMSVVLTACSVSSGETSYDSVISSFAEETSGTDSTSLSAPKENQTETQTSDTDKSDEQLQISVLPITPFSAADDESSDRDDNAEPSKVYVDYAPEDGNYNEIIADSGDYSSRLIFTADGWIGDFALLNLIPEEYLDDGSVKFRAEPAVTDPALGILSPENPVVVRLTFMGTIPNYGISYVDSRGSVRQFALVQSGSDGSISLQETNREVYGFVLGGSIT